MWWPLLLSLSLPMPVTDAAPDGLVRVANVGQWIAAHPGFAPRAVQNPIRVAVVPDDPPVPKPRCTKAFIERALGWPVVAWQPDGVCAARITFIDPIDGHRCVGRIEREFGDAISYEYTDTVTGGRYGGSVTTAPVIRTERERALLEAARLVWPNTETWVWSGGVPVPLEIWQANPLLP